MQPAYLVLDETHFHVGRDRQTGGYQALHHLHKEAGSSLILITQELEAALVADRILILVASIILAGS